MFLIFLRETLTLTAMLLVMFRTGAVNKISIQVARKNEITYSPLQNREENWGELTFAKTSGTVTTDGYKK